MPQYKDSKLIFFFGYRSLSPVRTRCPSNTLSLSLHLFFYFAFALSLSLLLRENALGFIPFAGNWGGSVIELHCQNGILAQL